MKAKDEHHSESPEKPSELVHEPYKPETNSPPKQEEHQKSQEHEDHSVEKKPEDQWVA